MEDPSISVKDDSADACASNEGEDKSESLASVESSSSLLSDEGISSGTDSPDKKCHTVPCGETDGASAFNAEGENVLARENEAQTDSVDIVGCVLEDLLLAVEKEVSKGLSQDQQEEDESMTSGQNFNQSASPKVPPAPHTYMAEYAKFVESYAEEDSPAFPSLTSSLTDVTPFSQNSEMEMEGISSSRASSGPMVVMDSLNSFMSDSDDSFSSSSTIQRQLTFQDTDVGSPDANLDVSAGFVRSSESKFDLREESPGNSAQSDAGVDGRNSPEGESLNLSVLDQKVEFLSLPSSSSLLRHAPKIIQSKLRSVATSPILQQSQDQSSSPVVELTDSSLEANKEMCDLASSPFAILVRDVQTMTISTEAATTSLSPIIIPSFEKSTATETVETSDINTSTATIDTNSIALSSMPVPVEEKHVNTSVRETTDADTMTQVLTSEVALSPVAVAVREMNTMTASTDTAEVGIATEEVQCQDHSMLATADLDNKMTMTDSTGCRNIFTSMTPLKLLAKQGHRWVKDGNKTAALQPLTPEKIFMLS